MLSPIRSSHADIDLFCLPSPAFAPTLALVLISHVLSHNAKPTTRPSAHWPFICAAYASEPDRNGSKGVCAPVQKSLEQSSAFYSSIR